MDVLSLHRYLEQSRGRAGAPMGQYYRAVNATPSTGIVATSTQQSFVATKGLFCHHNLAPSTGNVFIVPDYLRLLVTVVDVAATSFQYLMAIDNTLRFSSGGTQIVTNGTGASNNGPTNTQRRLVAGSQVGGGPQSNIFYGDLTLAAEGSAVVRTSRGCMKSNAAPLTVVNDEYVWNFSPGEDVGAGFTKGGTTPSIYRQNCGFQAIAPQGSLVMNAWFPAVTTGFTAELEYGWWEVPVGPI